MKSWLSRASQEEIYKLHMVTYRRHFERLKDLLVPSLRVEISDIIPIPFRLVSDILS